MELRHDPDHLPAYHLLFLTRHPAGMDVFSACLSSAQEEWRRAVFDEQWRSTVGRSQAAGQFGLFGEDDPDAEFGSQEAARVAAWTDTLAANLRLLVAEHPVFVVRDKQADVLKGVAGLIREKHIRAAMNFVKAESLIVNDTRGDTWSKQVVSTVELRLRNRVHAELTGLGDRRGARQARSDHHCLSGPASLTR